MQSRASQSRAEEASLRGAAEDECAAEGVAEPGMAGFQARPAQGAAACGRVGQQPYTAKTFTLGGLRKCAGPWAENLVRLNR